MSDDLQNAFHALSQQLYAQPAAGPAAAGNGNGHGPQPGYGQAGPDGEGEVVEGEFREA